MQPIHILRTQRLKISQRQFGDIAGVDQSTVSRWEKGLGEPSVQEARNIILWAAEAGEEVTLDDFFGTSPEDTPNSSEAA